MDSTLMRLCCGRNPILLHESRCLRDAHHPIRPPCRKRKLPRSRRSGFESIGRAGEFAAIGRNSTGQQGGDIRDIDHLHMLKCSPVNLTAGGSTIGIFLCSHHSTFKSQVIDCQIVSNTFEVFGNIYFKCGGSIPQTGYLFLFCLAKHR